MKKEKDEMLELIDGLKNSIRWWGDMLQKIESVVTEQYKPKYTAKDFPCLDLAFGDIVFFDQLYRYTIDLDNKHINKPPVGRKNNIDDYIDITECKLSDIKEGDYFASVPMGKAHHIKDYRYCTRVDNDEQYIYFDLGYDGYIEKDKRPLNAINATDFRYVKFTLKERK